MLVCVSSHLYILCLSPFFIYFSLEKMAPTCSSFSSPPLSVSKSDTSLISVVTVFNQSANTFNLRNWWLQFFSVFNQTLKSELCSSDAKGQVNPWPRRNRSHCDSEKCGRFWNLKQKFDIVGSMLLAFWRRVQWEHLLQVCPVNWKGIMATESSELA